MKTDNQIVAEHVLGYIPRGYVLCMESGIARDKTGLYLTGVIYAGKKKIASVPASLHPGRRLPTSQTITRNKKWNTTQA